MHLSAILLSVASAKINIYNHLQTLSKTFLFQRITYSAHCRRLFRLMGNTGVLSVFNSNCPQLMTIPYSDKSGSCFPVVGSSYVQISQNATVIKYADEG